MRVTEFTDWLEISQINYVRSTARDWRVALNSYRTEVLLPAFDAIRNQGLGSVAHVFQHEYGVMRDLSQLLFYVNIAEYVRRLNAELDTMALTEGASYMQFIGVALLTIKHRDLLSYNTPRGWMTRDAVRNTGGPNDVAAIRQVFTRNYQGERSAPMNGYPHFHVNGLSTNVMSIVRPNRILAFTAHIDGTAPGRTQQDAVNRAVEHAVVNGMVWVAVVDDTLYRIEHP